MTKKSKKYLKKHPIQLKSIDVLELFIRLNRPPEKDEELDKEDVAITHGHSDYDPKSKSVQVGIKLEVGTQEAPNTPFSMRIEVVGEFIVDEKRFKEEHIHDWASRNAQYILFPFVREHAYALTVRCGLPPAILPLLEVPTFTIKPPKKSENPEPSNNK